MDWDFSRLQLGSAGRVRCSGKWRMGGEWSRRLKDFDLFYVWAGEGRIQLRQGPAELKPGVCIWMRPGFPYRAEHNPRNPLGVTYIHFLPRTPDGRPCPHAPPGAPEYFELPDAHFFSVVADKAVRLRRISERKIREPDDGTRAHARERAVRLVRVLLAELEASTLPDPRPGRNRYQDQIESQVATIYEQPERAHPVRDLARQIPLSRHHYARVFREITGTSPRALVQDARMERACQLLLETPLSVGEVAAQAGYADVYQFSRLFKRRKGMAPSFWRDESR